MSWRRLYDIVQYKERAEQSLLVWQSHQDPGQYTLRDKAKLMYAEELETAIRQVPSMERIGTSCSGKDMVEKVWTIRKRKAAKRFTEKQSKDYLNGKFI